MPTQTQLLKENVACLFCGRHTQERYRRGLPNVVRCPLCGLVYANPRLKEESVKALYSSQYFESHESEKMGYDNYVSDRRLVEKTFRRRLEGLEKRWLKKKGRLLDVGCATGFFLSTARAMGWEAHGVEISDYCCEYAEREFGLKLFNGQFRDLPSSAGPYNLITMWDYVEHSFTPDQDIAKAFSLLEAGGILALATPDIGSWPAKLFGSNWVGFKEHEHLFYFSAANLTTLLKQNGFEVVAASTAGKFVSFKFFVKRLSGYFPWLGRALGWLADRPFLKEADFYCDPLDIAYLVARKPAASKV